MGAYYDIIISPACGTTESIINDLLATRGRQPIAMTTLEPNCIIDHNAILVSPPANGWVEILAGSGIGIDSTWYRNNPVATFLSTRVQKCIHIWSLNSGFVAGYSFFEFGNNVEHATVFNETATTRTELMPGVPADASHPGRRLGETIKQIDFDFSADLLGCSNLEAGIAAIIGRFGFPVQLVDYYDATDEAEGAAVKGGRYVAVPLSGWKAIRFR